MGNTHCRRPLCKGGNSYKLRNYLCFVDFFRCVATQDWANHQDKIILPERVNFTTSNRKNVKVAYDLFIRR